jgi:dihydroorotase
LAAQPATTRPEEALLARERRVYIVGGTVIDSSGAREADVVCEGGVVAEVTARSARSTRRGAPAGALVLEAEGCFVAPGLVDLHAHLREPGQEEAETIESGARAAALGGYTAVVAMPNTSPPADSAAVVRHVLALAKGAVCDVRPAGAITVGREGKVLAPMAEMAELGVHIFTDDGAGVEDAALMRRALEYASALGVVVADHCEDASLVAGGCMNEGALSSALGLPGRPAVAEEVMVLRDLALAREAGARLHLLHLSAAASVAAVRQAKAAGAPVTAEVTPHHLTLSEEALASYATEYKVYPPLRSVSDQVALREGLEDGTLDAIATDHAPHPKEAKQVSMCDAAPGTLGLETALAVVVSRAGLALERALSLMSWRPARLAGLAGTQGGPVEPGAPANLCVVDPTRRWVVRPEELASRSSNTAFAGMELTAKVRHTVFAGEPVVVDEQAQR